MIMEATDTPCDCTVSISRRLSSTAAFSGMVTTVMAAILGSSRASLMVSAFWRIVLTSWRMRSPKPGSRRSSTPIQRLLIPKTLVMNPVVMEGSCNSGRTMAVGAESMTT